MKLRTILHTLSLAACFCYSSMYAHADQTAGISEQQYNLATDRAVEYFVDYLGDNVLALRTKALLSACDYEELSRQVAQTLPDSGNYVANRIFAQQSGQKSKVENEETWFLTLFAFRNLLAGYRIGFSDSIASGTKKAQTCAAAPALFEEVINQHRASKR